MLRGIYRLQLFICASSLIALILAFPLPIGAQSPTEESAFPEIYNSEREPGEPLTPEQSLKSLQLQPGFSATLFAAEPDVQNPIAACCDAAGRIWVAENYTYAERSQRFDLSLRDRIVVLEDLDGDGVAEKRTVFSDTVQMLTGIAVGQGGVWAMCPPQLLFIPDADGDLKPDGPPVVHVDGFHVARENYHNFANGLSWGPDNWLYGRCGASCAGEMGLPGSADEDRVPVRGGIWRYHPQRKVVEALTQGTTNPWGHDWNAVGELFYINTVNGHLWHAMPGAHFVRAHTIDANPFSYELIDTHADHWHFDTGQSWTQSRAGAANDYGGGHAHIGMMIYHGERWPENFRQKLMTVNMHGLRVNTDELVAEGSGYVGRHGEDLLISEDSWFRGMDLIPLPDDNILLIDWSDTGECHESTGVHRTSGRIFKISYGEQTALMPGRSTNQSLLADPNESRSASYLANMIIDGSEWHARRARELLRSGYLLNQDSVEPAVASNEVEFSEAEQILRAGLRSGTDSAKRVRCLLALNAIEAVADNEPIELLTDTDAHVRAWAIRLLSDRWPIDKADGTRPLAGSELTSSAPTAQIASRLTQLAALEPEASVRLVLASTLQRLPVDERASLAAALMSHAQDNSDHNLPLMVWYGLIPVIEHAPHEFVDVLVKSTWPKTRQLMARRVAERANLYPDELQRLVAQVASDGEPSLVADVVLGVSEGLAGRRKVDMPDQWSRLTALLGGNAIANLEKATAEKVQQAVSDLSVVFGDGVAIDELKRLVADAGASLDQRRSALESLVAAQAPGLRDLCLSLLKQRFLNIVAAQGLASESDAEIGKQLLRNYRSFGPLDRPQVISILASRKPWAESLLAAVTDGTIDREEISPFQARQIAALNDPGIESLLAEAWGQVRETPAERLAQLAELKAKLTDKVLADADASQGRALFDKSCSACHQLFGQGGRLGPDLTGAQRSNLDYLLENMLDPSAVVTKEFRAAVIQLEDGRVLTGLVTSQSDSMITLATQNETYRIEPDQVVELKQSTASTMPDGLLSQMTEQQIADLFAYLQSSQQVVAAAE